VALERTVEELLQQVSGGVVLVIVADSGAWPARDRPVVQHLSWQLRLVDHGSTRMIREDALFVLILTQENCWHTAIDSVTPNPKQPP
jgi:hypothetical protein